MRIDHPKKVFLISLMLLATSTVCFSATKKIANDPLCVDGLADSHPPMDPRVSELPVAASLRAKKVSPSQLTSGIRTKIQLDMWEIKLVGPNVLVDSGGLGPCTAIFFFNRKTSTALVAHLVEPKVDGLEEMIKKASVTIGTPGELEVYVVGSQLDPLDEPWLQKYALNTREVTIKILHEAGFRPSNIFRRWTPDSPEVIATLQLNTGNGTVSVEYMNF